MCRFNDILAIQGMFTYICNASLPLSHCRRRSRLSHPVSLSSSSPSIKPFLSLTLHATRHPAGHAAWLSSFNRFAVHPSSLRLRISPTFLNASSSVRFSSLLLQKTEPLPPFMSTVVVKETVIAGNGEDSESLVRRCGRNACYYRSGVIGHRKRVWPAHHSQPSEIWGKKCATHFRMKPFTSFISSNSPMVLGSWEITFLKMTAVGGGPLP
uniref:Uncharacterized protein n=1 Tax=Kalanchoe fedtschenkoi TaxID=63787 RepID=A0A7N0TFY4_KALFE